MNVNNWLKKANDDLRTAEVMVQTVKPPTWIVCYHCQQSVEKYLKAYLVATDTEFMEVHDLLYLGELCINKDADFKNIVESLKELNPYAVTTRYPFVTTKEYTLDEAKEAIIKTQKVKEFIKKKLEIK